MRLGLLSLSIPTLKNGHWLEYDADAAHRANNAMHDFLAKQLAK